VRMFRGQLWICDSDPRVPSNLRCPNCSRFGSVLKAYQGHSQESTKSLVVSKKLDQNPSRHAERLELWQPRRSLVDLPVWRMEITVRLRLVLRSLRIILLLDRAHRICWPYAKLPRTSIRRHAVWPIPLSRISGLRVGRRIT